MSVEKWCFSEFLFKEHLTRSLNSFDQELLHVKNIVENLDRVKKEPKSGPPVPAPKVSKW